MHYRSTGSGGSIQLGTLASQLIQAGYLLMRLRGERRPDALFDALIWIVQTLRTAASGGRVSVPTFVGFDNISLESSLSISTPWGRIREYDTSWQELIPPGVGPATAAEDGTILGFILEMEHPYVISVVDLKSKAPGTPGSPTDKLLGDHSELMRSIEQTSLAFSLAIDRHPPVATALSWMLIFDPLDFGLVLRWTTYRARAVEAHRVNGEDARSVAEWARILHSVNDSNISIARRRLLSALSDRLDPVDAFIDAVIAWENLFGSGGELGFRISTSMAALLSSEQSERLDLQTQINKLYGQRSSVVHGGASLTPQLAAERRDDAIGYALKALRRLYRDHPEWIGKADIARRILLTGDLPEASQSPSAP